MVAHDLRSPLSAIRMSAQAALRQRALDEEPTRKALEVIQRATGRMGRLIADLLDLAALEAGELTLRIGPRPVAELIGEAVEGVAAAAGEADLRLGVRIPPGLPCVRADRDRLLQALSNLLGNAVKFTPPGGEIGVGAAAEGDAVRIWVSDTGPGMSAEDAAHVFDRFWQANQADRRGAGLGLGLAIARAIVTLHGGRIWVESAADRGSTFSFTIPATPR